MKSLPADQLPAVDKRDPFKYVAGLHQLMIDMEHTYLRSNRVTANDCKNIATVCVQEMNDYPASGTPEQQLAFERQYYSGFASTYIAAAEVARRMGWPKIGTFGNEPGKLSFSALSGTMSGLSSTTIDSDPDRYWNYFWDNYGQAVHAYTDLSHTNIYTPGWDERNVAFVLANLDFNVPRARALGKPLRPYLWARMDGAGWWQDMPLATEDLKAMTALAHFTGVDGLTFWDVSPSSNDIYHSPTVAVGSNILIGTPQTFSAISEIAGGVPYMFKRYVVSHCPQHRHRVYQRRLSSS